MMNIIGLSSLICLILFLHILIKRYEDLEKENKEIINMIKNKTNDKINNKKVEKKIIEEEEEEMNYEKYDLQNIEDEEGFDIENDFTLLKKDLLKYVDGARSYFKKQDFDSSNVVNNKKSQKEYNLNSIKKEYDLELEEIIQKPFGKTNFNSIEQQLEKSNKEINNKLGVKTLKPDMWVHKNENQMNGGELFKDTSLLAYDMGENYEYSLL